MKKMNITFISIMCGVAVCGGIYGMIYETIFYYFNNSVLCRRGSSFGPWIEIYGIGALLIYFLVHKYSDSPLKVFLISGISCGLLEFIAGYGMYHLLDGRRGWNYNTEILNFGNIGGYVCLRSVLVFAISGLLLIYCIVPLLTYISNHVNTNIFNFICIFLAILFALDVIYNDIFCTIWPLYSSKDLYSTWSIYKYYNETKLH